MATENDSFTFRFKTDYLLESKYDVNERVRFLKICLRSLSLSKIDIFFSYFCLNATCSDITLHVY